MSVSRQHTISEAICAQIAAGEWGPDQRLPVERALAERFACTRITLREALQQLEAEGRIYRENRRGWFVSAPRVRYDPTSFAGFMQYVAAQGRKPRTELLSATRQVAGAAYAAALRLDSQYDEVFVLQRRRWIDRRAVLLETNVVLAAWAPSLLLHDLTGSLSSVFNQQLGLFVSRAQLSMHPAGLDAAQAMLLHSTPGTQCFRLQRISFADDDRAVELDIESWRHDALDVVVRTDTSSRAVA